jgi:hypothetical protein
MHHAVTWGSLFGVGFTIGGLAMVAIGAIAIFAGGMSDAPAAGADVTKQGCIIGFVGVALSTLGIWMLI